MCTKLEPIWQNCHSNKAAPFGLLLGKGSASIIGSTTSAPYLYLCTGSGLCYLLCSYRGSWGNEGMKFFSSAFDVVNKIEGVPNLRNFPTNNCLCTSNTPPPKKKKGRKPQTTLASIPSLET